MMRDLRHVEHAFVLSAIGFTITCALFAFWDGVARAVLAGLAVWFLVRSTRAYLEQSNVQ